MTSDPGLVSSELSQLSAQDLNTLAPDYLARLQAMLRGASIPSIRALSRMTGLSRTQIDQLRQGRADKMRVDSLYLLSQALQVSLVELITTFSALPMDIAPSSMYPRAANSPSFEQLEQEYQRLCLQLQQQQHELQKEFQKSTLHILESWLIYFPTLIHTAQQDDQFSAKKFLPFIQPLEQLLKSWGIESIAPIGSEIPFDPQWHQPMQGTITPGTLVKVRYAGYRQGENLLYRAKVSPVAGG